MGSKTETSDARDLALKNALKMAFSLSIFASLVEKGTRRFRRAPLSGYE